MTVVEAIILAIAVLGAVLGLLNTWHTLDESHVKLKIVPGHAIPVGVADPHVDFYIRVTNLSAFPVTVNEVGLFYRGTTRRCAIVDPALPDRGPWPRRLEPRSSISVCGQISDLLAGNKIKCAYAMTDCGVTKRGNSPALRQFAAGWRKPQEQ